MAGVTPLALRFNKISTKLTPLPAPLGDTGEDAIVDDVDVNGELLSLSRIYTLSPDSASQEYSIDDSAGFCTTARRTGIRDNVLRLPQNRRVVVVLGVVRGTQTEGIIRPTPTTHATAASIMKKRPIILVASTSRTRIGPFRDDDDTILVTRPPPPPSPLDKSTGRCRARPQT